ncbi:MAG: hydrogenase 2 small subunit, partial [Rhodocyclales bacterium CG17_big_fil_post_rev_8_21_14_2_50_68_7]
KGVAFTKPIHQVAVMKNVVPPLSFPRIVEDQGKTSFASAAALAAIAGAAAGAAAMLARNLGKSEAGRQDAQPPKGE